MMHQKQRNVCVKILRKTKRSYYRSLNLKDLKDNRKFWKTVKPVFTDTVQVCQSVTLIENGEFVSDDLAIAEGFNLYFTNITKELGIRENETHLSSTVGIDDPIDMAIVKYSKHPSIKRIREELTPSEPFTFREITTLEALHQVEKLNANKASPICSIPARVIKDNPLIFADVLTKCFNNSLAECIFPSNLKAGDVSAIHKKDDVNRKQNYRPITILPSVSKIYERLIETQIKPFALRFLNPLLCGFREHYSTQHALLRFIEKCKMSLDAGNCVGAVFMDLSKAFDCLNHELLIAKLEAYGFSKRALTFIHSYLYKRKQRVKVNGSFSEWKEINQGVPQGSVLGPLLFNLYINDLLMFVRDVDICNYADDTTLYVSDTDTINILNKLESSIPAVAGWFQDNYMRLNREKCHFMVFGDKSNDLTIQIETTQIAESKEQKLLGITLDKKLTFKTHIESLCQKANQKLHALSRISCYFSTGQLSLTMKTFILSQFNYCPLVWMFCDRALDNKINRLHEKALRIASRNKTFDFNTLLLESNAVSTHKRNLQLLMIEVYKTIQNLNPSFMKEIFVQKDMTYSLRNKLLMRIPKTQTSRHGIESLSFLGSKLWNNLPEELKNIKTLPSFKRQIKGWKDNCNCRLCREFVSQVGFIT